jgi:F-type H+-transporting ATPase subunit delta
MAETLTIARPYAQAVFLFANTRKALGEWSEMLELLAAIAADPGVAGLIDSPRLTETQRADVFIDLGGKHLDEKGRNFIRLLAENRRLNLLPEIAALFEIKRRESEKTVRAELVSALPVSDAHKASVTEALKKRLGLEIELECSIDPALLGGAIIRAGDLVIDGSVRGKLERLGSTLNH